MIDIEVIIPMHDFSAESMNLLKKAVGSVPEGVDIVVSCKNGSLGDTKVELPSTVSFKEFEVDDSFQSLVNAAVEDCSHKWFSILEFDDTYTPIWLSNAERYAEFEPDTSVFMFLEDIYDFRNNDYIGFGNEAPWASSFSNEIGVIDLDSLQNFFNFYMTGSIFNTEDWKAIGGLKNNIKVSFWYEYLLRATNKGQVVKVIPKVGYIHYLNREGSLIDIAIKTISDKESEYWFDVAKKEYFFLKEREVQAYNGEGK